MTKTNDTQQGEKTFFVYIVLNPGEKDYLSEGYAGLTGDFADRRNAHRTSGILLPGGTMTILGEGTLDTARFIEKMVRPLPNIGRNKHAGGGYPFMLGKTYTDDEKALQADRMREIHVNRTAAQKAQVAAKVSAWHANLTDAERASISIKSRQTRAINKAAGIKRAPHTRLTALEREAATQKMLASRANRTPEQIAATREKMLASRRDRTPAQKAASLKKNRETRANRTPEENAIASENMRVARLKAHAKQTPEQKAAKAINMSIAAIRTNANRSKRDKAALLRKRSATCTAKRIARREAEKAAQ